MSEGGIKGENENKKGRRRKLSTLFLNCSIKTDATDQTIIRFRVVGKIRRGEGGGERVEYK